jgi:hypothetical protein
VHIEYRLSHAGQHTAYRARTLEPQEDGTFILTDDTPWGPYRVIVEPPANADGAESVAAEGEGLGTEEK